MQTFKAFYPNEWDRIETLTKLRFLSTSKGPLDGPFLQEDVLESHQGSWPHRRESRAGLRALVLDKRDPFQDSQRFTFS